MSASESRNRSRRNLTGAIILLIMALAQSSVLWREYAGPWTRDVLQTWQKQAIERSMIYQHWIDPDHRELLLEIRLLPTSTPVMLPPEGEEFVLSDHRLMQFLLFPREVIPCAPSGELYPSTCRLEAIKARAIWLTLNTQGENSIPVGFEFVPVNASFGYLVVSR